MNTNISCENFERLKNTTIKEIIENADEIFSNQNIIFIKKNFFNKKILIKISLSRSIVDKTQIIKSMLNIGLKQYEIAEFFGCSSANISNYIKRYAL